MSNGRKLETITIECLFKKATERAILIAYQDEEFWIPRVHLGYRTERDINTFERNQEISCTIMEFVAREKGII